MQRLRSWAATIVFLPVFGTILLVFDVAQRCARLFGQRPQEYVAGWLQMALVWAFGLCGTRLVVERPPGFEACGRYIVIANHQSMFDIPMLGSLLFSTFPKYISKRSLGRWIPSVSYNLRRGGHVLIERSDAPAALAAIRELGGRVRRGEASAVIFPEGTRARHGTLGTFKRAGMLALLDEAPDAPVLPVVIDESWRLFRHNCLPVPWGVRVYVRLGPPIHDRALGSSSAAMSSIASANAATTSEVRRTQTCTGGTRLVARGDPGAAASAIALGCATASRGKTARRSSTVSMTRWRSSLLRDAASRRHRAPRNAPSRSRRAAEHPFPAYLQFTDAPAMGISVHLFVRDPVASVPTALGSRPATATKYQPPERARSVWTDG